MENFLKESMDYLAREDGEVSTWLLREYQRQQENIELIASENITSPAVMAAMGSCLTNKYAEGYPGRRYYGGCEYVDEIERLAIDRAKALFGAEHANVQPHSGAQANLAAYAALLQPGDTLVGMDLSGGGHLTHGASVNQSGKLYRAVSYGVDPRTGRIDYDRVEDIVKEARPKLLVAGASAYPRALDFKAFADIAHRYGALLMVDMAHIAGLVAGGQHESPVPYADVVTTTTHKTLRGPRGGVILAKAEWAGEKGGQRRFPRYAGRPAAAYHRREGRVLSRGYGAGIPGLRPADGGKRRCPGECPAGQRLRPGIRRHGQPPDAGGFAQPWHYRPGFAGAAGRAAHYPEQKRHSRRPGKAHGHQRRAHRYSLCHHPGLWLR